MPPFTAEQFFDVFRAYNVATHPARHVLAALALLLFALTFRDRRRSARAVGAGLAVLWLWAGAIYHIGFFAHISGGGKVFGTLFVLQAMLLARSAFGATPLRYRATADARGVAGSALVLYSLLLYPLVGHLAGHGYPAAPTFGAPCPVTLFTLGMLLLAVRPAPLHLLAIPVLWALVGSSAALLFGVWQDTALLAAAAAAIALRRLPGAQPPSDDTTRSTWASPRLDVAGTGSAGGKP